MHIRLKDVHLSYASCIMVALNLALLLWRLAHTWPSLQHAGSRARDNNQLAEPGYTYQGDDYPIEYPMGELDPVAMGLYESVHFDLNASDSLAMREWRLLPSIPKGIGRTRLGPSNRVFVLSFHHQMHCLQRLQRGLVNRSDEGITEGHVKHCLNYLRQTMMCEAAAGLEEGDFMQRNLEEDNDRKAGELLCRDWERVYDTMDKKYEEWLNYSTRRA